MPTYELIVFLEPSRFIDIDVFEMAKIPDGTELAGITFRYVATDVKEGISDAYLASLTLTAATERDAKRQAVARVERVVSVLGVHNIPFRIRFPGVSIENAVEEGVSESSSVQERRNELYEMSAALGWVRFDVDFERRALSWRESWPEWLTLALDLNRLAVVVPRKSAYVIHYSILELMEREILGPPQIVLSALIKTKKKELRSKVDAILAEYVTDAGLRIRLLQRLMTTEAHGRSARFTELLNRFGLDITPEDVQPIINLRNELAHPGHEFTAKGFQITAETLRNWVQKGLKDCLEMLPE